MQALTDENATLRAKLARLSQLDPLSGNFVTAKLVRPGKALGNRSYMRALCRAVDKSESLPSSGRVAAGLAVE
jgi:hypothetical protein